MEKNSALQTTGSSTVKTNDQTLDGNPHQRLQIQNNSSTNTHTNTPGVSQHDNVHSTASRNQCAQSSTGQKALTPTLEQPTNSSTSNTGMDKDSPHGDKGTQMPSQEIHTTTCSQSTQFPSQQLESNTTSGDLRSRTSSTNTPDTASIDHSTRLKVHQGIVTRQPIQNPTLDNKTVDEFRFQQDVTISAQTLTIQMGHNPTPVLNTNHFNHGTRPEHAISSRVNNTTKGNLPQTNNPHATDAQSSEVPNPTGNTTSSSGGKTITQTNQEDKTSTTLSEPTPMVGPKVNHIPSIDNTNRDTAVISKHSHDVKGTLQSVTPPQKTFPVPDRTQKTGRECTTSPTLTINRNNPGDIDTENDTSQPRIPGKHHPALSQQREDKQKKPTTSPITHETEKRSNKVITITITHQDLNNNEQTHTEAIQPTLQHPTQSSISTRTGCSGTLYRLSPLGKSNKPLQQRSSCQTHTQNLDLAASNSAWHFMQLRDPQNIDDFHRQPDGTIALNSSGLPKCNYCGKFNHGRQNCLFRRIDLQYNIDRQIHPLKDDLHTTTHKDYTPYAQNRARGNVSPMSARLANEKDHSGNPRFWQTQCGHIIYSIDNQPQCSYCGIPSHGRDACQRRHNDESRGLFRIHHPQRGLLQQTDINQPESPPNNATGPPYTNIKIQETASIANAITVAYLTTKETRVDADIMTSLRVYSAYTTHKETDYNELKLIKQNHLPTMLLDLQFH